ncbi:hypothetical protein Tco_0625973, partial [Tanacetum coccineum]
VGYEAVHKELGDRMERAGTTASSLEVEQDSATARTSANGKVEITATIDGQVKTITEASLRRHLKLEDNGGVNTLPNSEISEQLALMGTPQAPNTQSTHDAEEAVSMPYESPLHSVHSLRRDEGSLSLSELKDEGTSWIKKIYEIQEKIDEEKIQRIARDAEIAKQLQEEINKATQEQEKQEVVTEADPTHVIDWSDPAVLRYHAQLNRPYSVAEVRKNMVMYLKNQGGYKMNYFKGIKYEDIRPIFEKVWDQIQFFAPMDSEKEKGSEKKGSRKKSLAMKRAGEKQSEESTKRQKIEDDIEKEELKAYLDLVLREEFAMENLNI